VARRETVEGLAASGMVLWDIVLGLGDVPVIFSVSDVGGRGHI
jgi:hypothetical protein